MSNEATNSHAIDIKSIKSHESKSQDQPCDVSLIIEISPNGKYLVTYSEQDRTIVGWDIEYIKKGKKVIKEFADISHVCVSDEKILAYIYNYDIS